MTAPRRLLANQGALPAQLRRALHQAPTGPQASELAALANKLSGVLGVTLPAPVPTALHALHGAGLATAASKPLLVFGLWALGGGVLGVGLSAVAALSTAAVGSPTPAVAVSQRAFTPAMSASSQAAFALVPTPIPAPDAAPATPFGGDQPPSSTPPARAVARSGGEARPATRDASADAEQAGELSLLRHAQQAVTSNPTEALALSARHALLFPNGMLSQESDVIAIEALLRLNRKSEAGAKVRAFTARYPGSAHARRLAALLEEP